jgi:hypothetical protein
MLDYICLNYWAIFFIFEKNINMPITKKKANECARVVAAYAKQEAAKNVKKGAKATASATKKAAQTGFKKLKGLFSK